MLNINSYRMDTMMEVGKVAIRDVVKYLHSMEETIAVINVEDDKYFQKQDVDLIWIFKNQKGEYMKKLEVKGDRYSYTGNFFLETHSNREKGTPGCFMYTKADYLLYYFIDTSELNIMDVKRSRKWFVKNMKRFEEKLLSTEVGNGAYYTSAGRLVPKDIMREETSVIRRDLTYII